MLFLSSIYFFFEVSECLWWLNQNCSDPTVDCFIFNFSCSSSIGTHYLLRLISTYICIIFPCVSFIGWCIAFRWYEKKEPSGCIEIAWKVNATDTHYQTSNLVMSIDLQICAANVTYLWWLVSISFTVSTIPSKLTKNTGYCRTLRFGLFSWRKCRKSANAGSWKEPKTNCSCGSLSFSWAPPFCRCVEQWWKLTKDYCSYLNSF